MSTDTGNDNRTESNSNERLDEPLIQRSDGGDLNHNSNSTINGSNDVDELFHEATSTATATVASTLKYSFTSIGDFVSFTTESLREIRWYYRVMGFLYVVREILLIYKSL